MDSTGSITFVLFDRNVTQFVGTNVQDLIESHVRYLWNTLTSIFLITIPMPNVLIFL
jgi:hypothetical protein